MDASGYQRSSRRTHAVEGVADNGSRVGRGSPLNSLKDTSPDPTPAFLPPEHEGRSADPTHSLSGRLVPPVSMQGPPSALAMKNPERGRAHMTCRQLLARRPPIPSARTAHLCLKMHCAMRTPDAQRILHSYDTTSHWQAS